MSKQSPSEMHEDLPSGFIQKTTEIITQNAPNTITDASKNVSTIESWKNVIKLNAINEENQFDELLRNE
jgi:hypothetical protein